MRYRILGMLGLVMSGGGARGAYEVGVLSWLLDDLPRRLGRPAPFRILTGSSVGAVHACYVAATMGDPEAGRRLAEIWRSLDADGVYEIGLSTAIALPLRLLGIGPGGPNGDDGHPDRLTGLLGTRPLERLVHEKIPWGALRRHVDEGVVEAVAIAATEIATGKSVVWVDRRGGVVGSWTHDPFVVARPAALTPLHALASASIPFLFPALRIGEGYFCDGGLRLNTPLAPAIRLGADRLLIVGLRHVPTADEDAALGKHREASYRTLAYLTGKVLNALLLDHVDYDVDRLRLVNAILETGARAYGPEFFRRINATVEELRGTAYRVVENVYLRPSRDLGVMAAECLEHRRDGNGLRRRLQDAVFRYAVRGISMEADLLSYLFFDRCYAGHLIELGRADAEAHADELVALARDG